MADVTLDTLEKTLPREYYLDDALYQREFAAIFHCDWVCIGRAEALSQPGDYKAVRFGEQSIVVLRGEAFELRAFYNVCRHRGNIVASSSGNKSRFSCSYHAWTYDLKGQLVGAPHM